MISKNIEFRDTAEKDNRIGKIWLVNTDKSATPNWNRVMYYMRVNK